MTEGTDNARMRLVVELACEEEDEARASRLLDCFRWMVTSIYPQASVSFLREGPPPGTPANDAPGAVIHAFKDVKIGDGTRGFHNVTVLAGDQFACECGYVIDGPTDAAVDAKGYIWNCPGCIEKLEEDPSE